MHTYLWERRLLLKPFARALIPEVALPGLWAAPLCRAAARPARVGCFAQQQRSLGKIPLPKISVSPCSPSPPYYTCKNNLFFFFFFSQWEDVDAKWHLSALVGARAGSKADLCKPLLRTIQFYHPVLGVLGTPLALVWVKHSQHSSAVQGGLRLHPLLREAVFLVFKPVMVSFRYHPLWGILVLLADCTTRWQRACLLLST